VLSYQFGHNRSVGIPAHSIRRSEHDENQQFQRFDHTDPQFHWVSNRQQPPRPLSSIQYPGVSHLSVPQQGMAAQVMSAPPAHFLSNQVTYGSDMTDSFHNFEALASGHGSYHPEHPRQSLLMVSPSVASSEISFRRRSSHSPQSGLVAPTVRDRTPIRHSRPSATRGRSHSRSEMLLAYAAEQNSLHPSQSLPSMTNMSSQSGPDMSHLYGMAAYQLSPGLTSYPQQRGYFGTHVQTNVGHQGTTDFAMPQGEGDIQNFYPVGRTPSHGSTMSLAPSESPNALYMTPSHGQHPLPSIGMAMQSFPPVPSTLESSPAEIEIMPSRPKPQCWDHGCNGRQFSTFSNLLRHQREKSGSATKAVCPHCGTEFTRTTARNGHMSGGKCKGRPSPESSSQAQEG